VLKNPKPKSITSVEEPKTITSVEEPRTQIYH